MGRVDAFDVCDMEATDPFMSSLSTMGRTQGSMHPIYLVIRVHEVFYLCLGELSHSEQACSGRDLVAVGLPYLCCCKR